MHVMFTKVLSNLGWLGVWVPNCRSLWEYSEEFRLDLKMS